MTDRPLGFDTLAIHAATALAGGAKGLITNDRGLSRLEQELKIWSLVEIE